MASPLPAPDTRGLPLPASLPALFGDIHALAHFPLHLAELLSVVIQVAAFKFFGNRVFLMSPLHHHFELKGWPESKIITRFWIAGAMLALVALSTIKIQ